MKGTAFISGVIKPPQRHIGIQPYQSLQVQGGCHGNLQGISKLVVGMKVEDVIARLEGIRCGFKPTSCPDQMAQALKTL